MLAALPALLLYLGWRWYVLDHFALGELKGLPVEQWHIRALPTILLNMLRAIGERGVFFAILFIALAVAAVASSAPRARSRHACRGDAAWRGHRLQPRAPRAYVTHFEGLMGIEAHSYFRYNTHLGLLLMAALVLYARDWRWQQFGGRWRRAMPALAVLLALIVPLPFLRMLRFDLEVPNLRAYRLAHEAALRIGDDAHLLLILPGDNGTLPPTIEGVLRDLPPRRPNVVFGVASDFATGLANKDFPRALLSCAPAVSRWCPRGRARCCGAWAINGRSTRAGPTIRRRPMRAGRKCWRGRRSACRRARAGEEGPQVT